jgi:hypothetical protein
MKELIVKHNFELFSNLQEIKDTIAQEIVKYDVIIEEDKLADAKVLMASFNKEKKEFSDTCKEFLKVVSEPITQFKAQQKEIESMYDDGRSKIASQVEKFEAKKLVEIEETILKYLNVECSLKNINPDSVSIKDLVMISAASGMSLTKKTKDAVLSRIQLIENEILKAKVEAQEKAARDAEIAEKARIETEERMKQREIGQAIAFARQKEQLKMEAQEREDALIAKQHLELEEASKQKIVIEETKVSENGQKIFVLNARFEVPAPWNSDPKNLEIVLKSKLGSFTSLVSVECLN